MPRLRTNILANYAGQFWVVLMGLAFVPTYVRELGAENFGLIGFMLSLQAVSLILDFGIGIYLSREIAARAYNQALRGEIRQLIRTFEWLIWPTALIIALFIISGSQYLAEQWLELQLLSTNDATTAIMVMGLAVASLWPASFYTSALTGLEEQPRINVIAVIFATLRYAGVLPIIFFLDAKLLGFIWWYAFVSAAQTFSTAWVLWQRLPPSPTPPGFHSSELVKAKHFAASIFLITASALVITQIDKLSLSTLRPLSELGLYTVAVTISAGLGRMVQPMFNAIYPRMSRLVAEGDEKTLKELYHLASQCLAVTALSIALVIGVYAADLLFIWTGDAELSTRVALPLTILVAGSALNGLMNIPYALQLAHGYTRLAVYSNLVALVLSIPFCLIAVSAYGMTGAAALWLSINIGYLLISVPIMHHRIFPDEMARWYFRDIFPPLMAATIMVILCRSLLPIPDRNLPGIAWLAVISTTVLLSAALASKGVRRLMWQHIMGILRGFRG